MRSGKKSRKAEDRKKQSDPQLAGGIHETAPSPFLGSSRDYVHYTRTQQEAKKSGIHERMPLVRTTERHD